MHWMMSLSIDISFWIHCRCRNIYMDSISNIIGIIALIVSGKSFNSEKPNIISCILFSVGHTINCNESLHNALATRRTLFIALLALNLWIIDLKEKYYMFYIIVLRCKIDNKYNYMLIGMNLELQSVWT